MAAWRQELQVDFLAGHDREAVVAVDVAAGAACIASRDCTKSRCVIQSAPRVLRARAGYGSLRQCCESFARAVVSISKPMLERPLAMAAAVVVPVPRKGSSTVSPINECIWIRRYGQLERVRGAAGAGVGIIESGVCGRSCRVPTRSSHTSENQTLRSSQKKALRRRRKLVGGRELARAALAHDQDVLVLVGDVCACWQHAGAEELVGRVGRLAPDDVGQHRESNFGQRLQNAAVVGV